MNKAGTWSVDNVLQPTRNDSYVSVKCVDFTVCDKSELQYEELRRDISVKLTQSSK